MASSILDLGKTEHDFPNRGLKLLIRSTIHVTFPQSSVSCQSSQELITAGFWIMRGNGLNLSIRIGFGLPVGPQTGRENFSNGLIDVLCAAKLWPQLSLKASCVNRRSSVLDHQIHIALALSHSASPCHSLSKAEHALAPSANVHDVKPPAGVSVGFLDSIELVIKLLPLALPNDLLPVQSPNSGKNNQGRKSTQYHLRSHAVGNGAAPRTPLGEGSVEDGQDEDDDILFRFPDLGTQACDTEMPDSDGENKDDLLFADPTFKSSIPSTSESPLIGTQPKPQQPPFSQHPSSYPLDILKLIDASLRNTISGTSSPKRSTKKSNPPGISLVRSSSSPSLADVAPALFRPGYMPAISSRAPLIPPIASSLSAILSRSRSHTPHHHQHQSPPPQANNNLPPLPPTSPTTRELQLSLWHLLQTRKWPTTPLEPLECTNMAVFERCEQDGVMLLSSSPSLSPPPSFSPPHRYHSASGGSISVVKAENDDGDEDMLDTSPSPNPYPYQCDGGNGMLEEVNEEEEEEDLFSSLEETPFASQDMGGAGEEEMLDDEDDEVEMGEGLLLGEDEELSSSRLGMEESWCGGSRGGVLCVEGTGVDGLGCLEEGMEDEEVWGMLF